MTKFRHIISIAKEGRPELAAAMCGTYAGDGRIPISRMDVARRAAWIAAKFPHRCGRKFDVRRIVKEADQAFRSARAGHYGQEEIIRRPVKKMWIDGMSLVPPEQMYLRMESLL